MTTTPRPTWDIRITGDDDTVDAYLVNGQVTPQAPTAADMGWVAQWLATYASEDPNSDDVQTVANVMFYLLRKEAEMSRRAALNAAKRAYAAEHGIPVRQVRVKS